MKARIAEKVYIPRSVRLPSSVKQDMLVTVWDVGKGEQVSWELPYESRRHYHFPRQYGIALAERLGLKLEDWTSIGYFTGYSNELDLRPEQEPWVNAIVCKFESGIRDVFAQAGTGKGKTVMSLDVHRRLCRTTLVLVDQNFLRDQWVDRAKQFLGYSDDDIGVIQGKVTQFEGKKLVIGMVQSLYGKKIPGYLKDYFGLVILDEAHVLGAEQFSSVLGMFNARNRLAISATPDRRDGLQKILDLHMGPVQVEMREQHQKSKVRYIINKYTVPSSFANSSPKAGKYINELAGDTLRNHIIVKAICQLYDADRNILAVSDRTEHLSDLKALLILYGVPETDIGIVAGVYYEWGYVVDDKAKKKPVHLEEGAEYTPIKLARIARKAKSSVLEYNKGHARIILATYGMFSKGVDVPRLDAGIDCTPRSSSVQVHGRVLRALPGKKVPIWVTILDAWSYKAELQFVRRLQDYLKSNVEVFQWNLEKGVRRVDPKQIMLSRKEKAARLKKCSISMRKDGNNIVVIPSTGTKY